MALHSKLAYCVLKLKLQYLAQTDMNIPIKADGRIHWLLDLANGVAMVLWLYDHKVSNLKKT
jgi:hypothetical protein